MTNKTYKYVICYGIIAFYIIQRRDVIYRVILLKYVISYKTIYISFINSIKLCILLNLILFIIYHFQL